MSTLLVIAGLAGAGYMLKRYAKTNAVSLKDQNKALESAIEALQDRQEIEKRTPKDLYAQAVKYAKK